MRWLSSRFKAIIDEATALNVVLEVELYVTGFAEPHSFEVSNDPGRGLSAMEIGVETKDVATVTSSDLVSSSEGLNEKNGVMTSGVAIRNTRPDLQGLVAAAAAAGHDRSSLAVQTCGPAGMADAVRAAVVAEIPKAKCRIDYYEEAFGW